MGVASDLLSGTISGCAASLTGQPLDTVRVRLQSRGSFYTGSWDVVLKTFRADGLRGFFRGAIPPLLGMGPRNAIGFASHCQALRFLEGAHPQQPTIELKRNAKMRNIAAAGCIAGLVQCVVVVPSDRIKCQLQVQGIQRQERVSTRTRAGVLQQCVATLLREDGLQAGLFRGWWPTVWRQGLSAPVYFGTYEALKRASLSANHESAAATMMCGGIAGVSAYATTYPFDIMKSYAHAAPPGTPGAEVGMRHVAALMRQQHGQRWWLRAMAHGLRGGWCAHLAEDGLVAVLDALDLGQLIATPG